jgi:cysteine-S-conjugate beta-lyase
MSAAAWPDDPYGFDRIDRSWLEARPGAKWHRPADGVLAAWVADMDFPTADVITDSLHRFADAADFGYPDWNPGSPLRDAFCERMQTKFGWDPKPSYVRETCEVLQVIELSLMVATNPGDPVALFCPSYPPALNTLGQMNRPLVPIMLDRTSTGWALDTERFANDIASSGARAIVLLNPHNPTGHVFTRIELLAIAEAAERHDLLVISDEIHADIVFEGTHMPFAALNDTIVDRTVTTTSATKAFNIAGVRAAVVHVGSAKVRDGWNALPTHLMGVPSAMGVEASVAAWTLGDHWLDAVMVVLDRNRHLLADLIATKLPGVQYTVPAATYLAWLDCRALNLDEDPKQVFLDKGQVELSPGSDFGPGGVGHVRVNFATSESILVEIVDRMAAALRA